MYGNPFFWRHCKDASQFLFTVSLCSRAIVIIGKIKIHHQRAHQIFLYKSPTGV
jgi:hypothetical protein